MPRPILAFALCLVLGACGDKAGGADDTSTGGGGDGGDGGGPVVYPEGDRVLLYYGHGGNPGSGTGKAQWEEIEARWRSQGYSVDHRDYLPENVEEYRLVVMIAPGFKGDQAFSVEDTAWFEGALAMGVRVFIGADLETCALPGVNGLLAELGTTLSLTGDGTDANRLIETDAVNSNHQVMEGVRQLRFKEPCYVGTGAEGQVLAESDRNPLAAAQRVGNGGDVLVFGDHQFFDDSGELEVLDNQRLADNLVQITPAQ